MPVLAIFEQPNLDGGTYASMLEQLMPVLRSAKGFMSHAGGPSPAGGTRIIEIWESEQTARSFSTRTWSRISRLELYLTARTTTNFTPHSPGRRPRRRSCVVIMRAV